MIKKYFLTILGIVALGCTGEAVLAQQTAPSAVPADKLAFEALSLEEQLGQTLTVFVDIDNAEHFREVIESGKVGGVLIQWGNYSLLQTRELIQKLQGWAAKSPHQLPLLVSIDYEGGTVYTPITLGLDYLPTNMMLAAAGDENLAASLAYLAGQELKRVGIHINFSPVLDVNSNPHNPIIGVRSFGSNPANVAKMGLALVDGFEAAGVMSVVKHFPGHGDTAVDSHQQIPTVQVPSKELVHTHLAPFVEAIRHQVSGIMTSHIIYPAFDKENVATFSPIILQNLLRKQLGFKGLVVTDSLDMKAATSFCTIANCALKSLAAGADLILLGHYKKINKTFPFMLQQVKNSPTLQKRVQESAQKIFKLKKEFMRYTAEDLTAEGPMDAAYQVQLEQISHKAVTLVRDRNQLLPYMPFTSDGQKPTVCAVFFAPTRFADQLGTFAAPFLEQGWNIRSYNAALSPREIDIARACECAKGADLLVVTSLQWADKINLNQKKAINTLLQRHPKNILISTMSPYDILHYPQADTVLATYGLNKYVLQTVADIILGKQVPQGKLPIQLPTEN